MQYPSGSPDGTAILQDRGIQMRPRLYAWEGAPSPASPEYYTKAQITSILKHYQPVGSDSSTGTVINGEGDPAPELGLPGDLYIDTLDHKLWLKG